ARHGRRARPRAPLRAGLLPPVSERGAARAGPRRPDRRRGYARIRPGRLRGRAAQEGGQTREGVVEPGRVPPGAEHVEPPGLPVEARLDAADEVVAHQDGKDVVAVLALVVVRRSKFFLVRYRGAEEEE